MTSADLNSTTSTETPAPATAEQNLEVVTLNVSDIDRAKGFYQSLGWRLDADRAIGDDFRIVQFTPPRSQCSIHFGQGLTAAGPGGPIRLILAVADIDAARADLISHGAAVSEVYHYERQAGRSGELESRVPGPDPDTARSYSNYASFSDPDGNLWLLQEITKRLPGRDWRPTRTSRLWQRCCRKRPSTTARSRRSPRRTTGGTGTRRTWTRASAGAPRRRPPRRPAATWPRSSTSSCHPPDAGPDPARARSRREGTRPAR